MTRVVKRTFGVDAILRDRLPRFIKWQSIQSIPIYFFGKTLLSPLAPSTTFFGAVYAFILFQISLRLFSNWLFLASSPRPVGGASPMEFVYALLKLECRGRTKVTLRVVIFVACSGISTSMAIVCLYGSVLFGALGLRGFIIGLVYGWSYKTCVYDFPIIQRVPFRRYKLGVGQAFVQAVKLAFIGGVCLLPLSGQLATGDLIEHVIFFFASFLFVIKTCTPKL